MPDQKPSCSVDPAHVVRGCGVNALLLSPPRGDILLPRAHGLPAGHRDTLQKM
ncbi:MAG: hypothetical protein LZT29_01957 [Pantoea stewartii]|nr:MAG: hypothetical protein LZT29_01957 [Pantoea stewartii]